MAPAAAPVDNAAGVASAAVRALRGGAREAAPACAADAGTGHPRRPLLGGGNAVLSGWTQGAQPASGAGNVVVPELNVRTYVRLHGKPGVYFFSLDAGAVLAVMGARLFYALPYFYAHMRVRYGAESVHYVSSRRHKGKIAEFEADYGPVGSPSTPAPGSLEQFLVERYCLYAVQRRRVYRAEIHHVPWPLQPAKAVIATNTVAQAAGIELPSEPPLLHFARYLEVLVWTPERLA
jgi:uncharacterized protein YqjF (DUF2071 family)